jgi:hypothetical protein
MEVQKLQSESTELKEDCEFCQEVHLNVGGKGEYGAVIVAKIGSAENGWYATISPRTGGKPEEDFSIQLMSNQHLTHFSQLAENEETAKNYGLLFAKCSKAMVTIMAENPALTAVAETREDGMSVATWAKCTTWKEKKEHLHIKLFQFKNDLSQPCSVDSTFGRKEIENDAKGEFVRMTPIRKQDIPEERFQHIAQRLIELLENGN